MKVSVSFIVRIFFLTALFVLAVGGCYNMRAMEGADEGNIGYLFIIFVYLVWMSSVLKTFLPNYVVYKPATPIILYAVFILWTIFPTMMSGQENMVYNLIFITLPGLVLISTYNTVLNYGYHKWHLALFCLMLGMFTVQYVMVFNFINIFDDDSGHLAVSYYTLYMLPLVFLCKSKTIRVVATIVATIVVLSSLKRSGVVAIVLAIFVYIIINQHVKKKLTPTAILSIIGLLLLFATFFIVFGSMGEETVFERFENIGNDNGSGRLVVWEMTTKMISRLDVGNLLIGEGYNSVVVNSPVNLSAHNDFLEVIYDYGLIGLALYVCAFLSVCYYTVKMIASKSVYAPSMAMLMVIYLIQSMISHIIIYYWASLFMLSFGYLIGNYQRDAGNR